MHHLGKHSRTRSLCLCVDDFGLHAGINNAALRLASIDRVHAISCLVGAPAWRSWGRLLQRLDGHGMDIGLHLDLTEHPLLARTRRPLPRWIIASQLHRIAHAPLRAEIRAQLDAFEDRIGHAPAFVDGHQHVHQFPVVRTELLDELERRYGAYRPWLRSTRVPGRSVVPPAASWRDRAKPHVIHALGGRGLAALARERGYPQNRSLLGAYDFAGTPAGYLARLAAWLAGADDGALLMCHPNLDRAGHDPAVDPLRAARDLEYRVLAGAEFGRLLDEHQIALRPMSQILVRQADARAS